MLPQINGIMLEDRKHSDAVELFRTAGTNVELRVLKKVGVMMLQDLLSVIFIFIFFKHKLLSRLLFCVFFVLFFAAFILITVNYGCILVH